MHKISQSFTRAALLLTFVTAASSQTIAGQTLHSPAADEVKPPVFVFARLLDGKMTDTRALSAEDIATPVWTDDYRPAPASFYSADSE